MTAEDRLLISVVMPAYNCSHLLPQVLPPLLAMHAAGEVAEVLVIDDRSTDETARLAREMGATVRVAPKNGGPGAARNLAAEEARGDVLWFVDSDVIALPGGPELLRAAFAQDNVGAVFGSYDAEPGGPWFSRYKNLLHRYHHHRARGEASTFWAGCGAVRADVFRALGGFDVETYEVPSIEDIELGYRIRALGHRILVEPRLQGKHLKVWTMRNGIFTDIFRRALPWSRLMIAREGLGSELNTSGKERMKALLALLLLLSVLALPFAPQLWWLAVLLLVLAFAANARLARMLARHGGIWLAIRGVLYHQLYFVYSAGAYVWCLFEYHVLGRRQNLHVRKN
ncbi:glycosyltransferase family 2 protein (plasmid) [Roseobacteraceae bacterium NS-SX3]